MSPHYTKSCINLIVSLSDLNEENLSKAWAFEWSAPQLVALFGRHRVSLAGGRASFGAFNCVGFKIQASPTLFTSFALCSQLPVPAAMPGACYLLPHSPHHYRLEPSGTVTRRKPFLLWVVWLVMFYRSHREATGTAQYWWLILLISHNSGRCGWVQGNTTEFIETPLLHVSLWSRSSEQASHL